MLSLLSSIESKLMKSDNPPEECRNLLHHLALGSIILMRSGFCHPGSTRDYNACYQTRFEMIVGKSKTEIKSAKRLARKMKIQPEIRTTVDKILKNLNLKVIRAHNAKPTSIISKQYLNTSSENYTQNCLETLFPERYTLSIENSSQRLLQSYLHSPCSETPQTSTRNSQRPIPSVQKYMDVGLMCQEQAHSLIEKGLRSSQYYDYLYYIHTASPYLRSATIAFRKAHESYMNSADHNGQHDAETEAYVSEELYANCSTLLSLYGTSMLTSPFTHIYISEYQQRKFGIHRPLEHLLEYLIHNDVIFPDFCRDSWLELTVDSEFSRFLKFCRLDQRLPDAEFHAQVSKYQALLEKNLDTLSSTLLHRCKELQYWELGEFRGLDTI